MASLLRSHVDVPSGIPSHDTIARVLAKLNPDRREGMFGSWMSEVARATDLDSSRSSACAGDRKDFAAAFTRAYEAFHALIELEGEKPGGVALNSGLRKFNAHAPSERSVACRQCRALRLV